MIKMVDYDFPNELLYTKDHLWLKKQDGNYLVGVNEFVAKQVNEFVFIDLPDLNKEITKGDVFVSLEAIKWSGHLNIPFSGKITCVNEELFDEPDKINNSPYDSWLIKIKPSNEIDESSFLNSSEIKQFVDRL
jgi:glycine cleavage system H protein